jgi:hypothetical protein
MEHLVEALERIDVDALARDVSAFLERPADRALLARENLRAALAEAKADRPGGSGLGR